MEQRNRKWSLVINEEADCFSNIRELLEDYKITHYALILHDKDIDENGEPKKPHYHAVLEYKNAKSFNALKNEFKGAHIEPIAQLTASYKYLLHMTEKAKEEGKFQYELDSIITNDLDYLKQQINANDFIAFEELDIPKYIAMGIYTAWQFLRTFGKRQYKDYFNSVYVDILKLFLANDQELVSLVEAERIKLEEDLPF